MSKTDLTNQPEKAIQVETSKWLIYIIPLVSKIILLMINLIVQII